jgi:putative intracellular protease/amidase
VVDGNIITSRGPGTSLEFSLKLAAMLVGSEAAEEIQGQMLARF